MNYLQRGQYRKVRYADDGCEVYQCLWCKRTIEIRDNPDYWNFCPLCGRSWFKRAQCRSHEVPRWYYDRWGNAYSPVKIKTPGGEFTPSELRSRCYAPLPKLLWDIESRTRWAKKNGWDSWGGWELESTVEGDYREAWRTLLYYRDYSKNGTVIESEYRVRLRKNLTTPKYVI